MAELTTTFVCLGDVYVPCNRTSINTDVISKAPQNDIPNDDDFSIRHDVRHFTTENDSLTHSASNDFNANDGSVFVESQICVVSRITFLLSILEL